MSACATHGGHNKRRSYEVDEPLTRNVERSVYAGRLSVVTDSVASRADDLHIFTFVLRRNSERLPSGTLHLGRHRRIDADPRCGISPRVAFYLVTNRDVATTRSKLYFFHQICVSTNKYNV